MKGHILIFDKFEESIRLKNDGIDVLICKIPNIMCSAHVETWHWKMDLTSTLVTVSFGQCRWIYSMEEIKANPKHLIFTENPNTVSYSALFCLIMFVFFGTWLGSTFLFFSNIHTFYSPVYVAIVKHYESTRPKSPTFRTSLTSGEILNVGEKLCDAKNHKNCVYLNKCKLTNGEFYDTLSSDYNVCHLIMQDDGNLVLYNYIDEAVGATGTKDEHCDKLTLEDKNLHLHCKSRTYIIEPGKSRISINR